MTKNKSNPIALLLAAILWGIVSFAQSIHFNYTDGANATYNLEDVRKITFDEDVMNLHLFDGSMYSWNVSSVGYFQYDENPLSLQEWLNNVNAWEVNVFPNPIGSSLTVSFNLPNADEVLIELFDLKGKQLLTKNIGKKEVGKHQEVIDLTDIIQGSYIFRISCQKNVITKKIIKQ